MQPLRTLLVEDNPADVRLFHELLKETQDSSFELMHAARLERGIELLSRGGIDVVLLDLGLPDERGYDTFDKMHMSAPDVPIVVLTGLDDGDLAMRAVQGGAQDYLVKGAVDGSMLARSIRYAVERHRLTKKIEQQARRIEREENRARFVEIMAHELRNPMSAAKAILALLRLRAERNDLPDDLVDRLETAEREVDRVSGLLNEVLEAFRADRDQLNIRLEPVNLVEVVKAAMKPFEISQIDHPLILRGLTVGKEIWVSGDSDRLEQVIRNLIENAVKYSPGGGAITVSITEATGRVRVGVSDRGLGIPEDQLGSIFDGFYRTESAADLDLSGLGLGLFISSSIVERHGGRIWAENNPDEGATFWVELPVAVSLEA